MMHLAIAMGLAVTGAALSAPAQQAAVPGGETIIPFAANGGIRDYKSGGPGILFVRDRTERWYRVMLTGDCLGSRSNVPTLAFTTDSAGTFDRFSRVTSSRYPERACGVTSIVRTAPPPEVLSRKG